MKVEKHTKISRRHVCISFFFYRQQWETCDWRSPFFFLCVCACLCACVPVIIFFCRRLVFVMRPAFKVALYIAAALLVLIGIVVAFEMQLREQRRMIDTIRADQIRALSPRKVNQMIDDAMSGRRPMQQQQPQQPQQPPLPPSSQLNHPHHHHPHPASSSPQQQYHR
jgi:hypothetical protein